MKTIEQLESEIEQKSGVIKDQLFRFENNIGKIGSVIGKDATSVHATLTKKFNNVIHEYNNTTRRNVEILGGYVAQLDKVLVVLHEVMISIDDIDGSPAEDQLPMRERVDSLIGKATDMADNLSNQASTAIQKKTGVSVQSSVIKYAIYGVGTYMILRWLKVPTLFSMAGAAGIVMVMNEKDK